MKSLNKLVLFLFFLLLFNRCAERQYVSEPFQFFPLTLIHLNDTHSHLEPTPIQITLPLSGFISEIEAGDITRIVTKVHSIRAQYKNTLFLHAGDMCQGTLYYVRYQGDSDLYFYNLMNLDVMVTGNHEYDSGPQHLADFIKKADFPIIAANVDTSKVPFLQDILQPYVIKEIDGEKIGIIGIVTRTVPSISSPGDKLLFADELTTAQQYIDILESQGINKIIILSHIGYENDILLAENLKGADIIIGGHSHSLLGDFQKFGLDPSGPYPTVIKNNAGESVLIVQAWNFGLVLGSIRVLFDNLGLIKAFHGMPVIVTGNKILDNNNNILQGLPLQQSEQILMDEQVVEIVKQDEEARNKMTSLEKGIQVFKHEIIAESTSRLKHIRMPTPEMPGGSLIAPLVCESMLWKMRQLGIGADFALQNAGGVRTDIAKGTVSVADVFTLLPFNNTLVTLELSGQNIKTILEDSIGSILDNKGSGGAFPYVAGLQYGITAANTPGNRVHSLKIQTAENIWQDLDMKKTYKAVTNSYLAKGKNGYELFAENTTREDTGLIDAHVFMEYLRVKKNISPVGSMILYR